MALPFGSFFFFFCAAFCGLEPTPGCPLAVRAWQPCCRCSLSRCSAFRSSCVGPCSCPVGCSACGSGSACVGLGGEGGCGATPPEPAGLLLLTVMRRAFPSPALSCLSPNSSASWWTRSLSWELRDVGNSNWASLPATNSSIIALKCSVRPVPPVLSEPSAVELCWDWT